MEKWEYLTCFLEARVKTKETKEFLEKRFNQKRPARYAPESMIPELNKLGDEGWELVHMEPVAAVGGKGDVRFDNGRWSNHYFCVLKRRKPDPSANSAGASTYTPTSIVTPQPIIPPHE
jgi:hypothetical protein